MSANLEQAILEKLHSLPDERQKEVLALVDELLQKEQEPLSTRNSRPIWEIITELSSEIPIGEWAQLPTDGAEQHDHYLYGSPKRSNS
jgi:hypothetical protein